MRSDLVFQGFASTGWLLFTAAAVVAAGVLMVMLLRYERRLVPPGVGWSLLALRMAVLGVLFLTFLQPVLTWSIDRSLTGRVLVAIDLSESMATADTHATRAEKLRWARALGMIGNEAIDDRLDRWMQSFEAGEEPQWVDEKEAADEGRREQLERTRREYLDGIFAELDRLPRKEIARRLLTTGADPLLARLEKQGGVELAVFAGKAEAAEAATLEAAVSAPPSGLLSEASDLAAGLSAVPAASETSPLVGVVVLTDGRDNAGRDPVGLAARLGTLNAPVYPVLVGSALRPKDLAIASVDYPLTVFKDDKPILKALVNTSGFDGEEIPVILERRGKEPVTKIVRAHGRTTAVDFELDATETGRQEYTVRTEVREGETRGDNNSRSFAMTVVDDLAHVLLLEGEARWEFRFIDNALSRDERVDVRKVVYRQPYMGVLGETFFPRTLPMPAQGDAQDSPFAEPDVVILGDVSPADIPARGWELLEKFVAEGGGTLVMIAGKQHFPLSYAGNPVVERLVPVTRLRPIDVTGAAGTGAPAKRGFRMRLTPDGESEAMLQFDADPVENRKIWSRLPGHLWGLIGEAKPGATVFAYAGPHDQPDGLKAERENAVMVQAPYGFGQVLWIGVDSTWRWRHRVGDKYHHRFWEQIGRWAAENRAAAGNEHVKFGPDRSDIQLGEAVTIRARFSQPFVKRFPALKAKAEILRSRDANAGGAEIDDAAPGERFALVDLLPAEGRPLAYEARMTALPGGAYRVRLIVEGAEIGDTPIETPLFVNKPQTLELSDLSANRELLQQLADVSRGRLFLPDELEELPPLLKHRDLQATSREDKSLWDHWLTLVLFFGLLTTEWVVRKLNGLP